jgi:hypothetical protein
MRRNPARIRFAASARHHLGIRFGNGLIVDAGRKGRPIRRTEIEYFAHLLSPAPLHKHMVRHRVPRIMNPYEQQDGHCRSDRKQRLS